ncbi:MAG: serine/threonine protein kinase, partial [Myxococcales bacterium]|nr:serine/threonine protein kinase [Myxococcales bacterium]
MSTPPPTRPPTAGQPIANGHYLLKRPIGKGAMGTVWEAVHVALERRVAVKLLHPHMMERPLVAERFRREAKAASLLRHRNTIQLLDFGNDGPVFYLVMELLEGRDLAEVALAEGAVDPLRAVTIMAQVAAALGAAHDKGIVHRDMKPSNIMLVPTKDDDGNDVEVVKVLDFGIAKLIQNELEAPEGGAMMTMEGDV